MGGCVGTRHVVRDPRLQKKNSQSAIQKKLDRLSTDTSKLRSIDINLKKSQVMEQVALLQYFNSQMSSRVQTSGREKNQVNQDFSEARRKSAEEKGVQSGRKNKNEGQSIPSWICENIQGEEEGPLSVSLNRDEIRECQICMVEYANTENRLPMMICMNQHTYCKECVTKIACKDSLCPIDRIPFNIVSITKNRLIMNALKLH